PLMRLLESENPLDVCRGALGCLPGGSRHGESSIRFDDLRMLRITANPYQTFATQGEVAILAERAGARDAFSALSFKEIMKSFPDVDDFVSEIFQGISAEGQTLQGRVFEDCGLNGCNFSEATFADCKFVD